MSEVQKAARAYAQENDGFHDGDGVDVEDVFMAGAAWQRKQSAIIKVYSGHTGQCDPGCTCPVAQSFDDSYRSKDGD